MRTTPAFILLVNSVKVAAIAIPLLILALVLIDVGLWAVGETIEHFTPE